jgi:hypothetical protein
MAKFCPECGMKLITSDLAMTIDDSIVTRSPGAGSNYAPVINISNKEHCSNCDMEFSNQNKPLICMECGAKFCEHCESFYRVEIRQRGDQPLCFKCYANEIKLSPQKPNNSNCPNCDNVISNQNKSLLCMECGVKFCENCEGFYRRKPRQRGEKPLCYECYTTIFFKAPLIVGPTVWDIGTLTKDLIIASYLKLGDILSFDFTVTGSSVRYNILDPNDISLSVEDYDNQNVTTGNWELEVVIPGHYKVRFESSGFITSSVITYSYTISYAQP